MMRVIARLVWSLAALAGLAAIATGLWLFVAGISARREPGGLETSVARAARHAMIPAFARSRTNPTSSTADNVREGMEHWADHCAQCHGNNGDGDTEMGKGLYPRAPDMRQPATQNLSDGELFYIIENGVKLTGMPAWSTGRPDGEESSWHLVQFIRHMPKLTAAEIAEMESLNPRGPEEWRQREEEQKFLEGGDQPKPAPAPSHKH